MSYQAVCVQAWLDVPADVRITGEVERDRDVKFTITGQEDEFDVVFEPAALRRFIRLAEGLLAQLGIAD